MIYFLFHQFTFYWRSKLQQLSFLCWPTLPGRFSRPFTQSTLKSRSFWWRPCVSPLRRNGRGTPSGVLIFLGISLLTPFRFATII